MIHSVGLPLPLGATLTENGVHFSVFSRHAQSIELLLFDKPGDRKPEAIIGLDPSENKTGDIWHVNVHGTGAGQLYMYRVKGPFDPVRGHRYNENLELIDPYAKALTYHQTWDCWDPLKTPRCVVIDDEFDWQKDRTINYPLQYSVIYETHVGGLTRDSSSGSVNPGTYLGVIEKIPYFLKLGITSLEFLPIQEFNPHENRRTNPRTGIRLENYWGYNPVAFFAPATHYAVSRTPGDQVREFKTMVRELHKAGLEVILDVVFNHTAEGNENGPTFSLRGFDNSIYYILDQDRQHYQNFSGCGNTCNCNHPIMRSLILDCLHYWVIQMHIDGFRFDLGSILGRDQTGELLRNPPVLETIAEDPILRNTKIIAEAWDAAGAYQVGSFPGGRWAEWNDRYRDDVREYWRGKPGFESRLAMRLSGSSDLYLADGRKPFHSINFITSHDGFTLNDLVSYTRKRNIENGESNRDGNDSNLSANCGIEGETQRRNITLLRKRMVKNFLATLLLSTGTPMILGGDEFMRSQKGNNNAYCQNNHISWYDWKLIGKNGDVFRFCRELINFRRRHPAFTRPDFYAGVDINLNGIPDISWYDEKADFMVWSREKNQLAFRIDGSKTEIFAERDDNDFYLMFNSSAESIEFTLASPPPGRKWKRKIDTFRTSPDDILDPGKIAPLENVKTYKAGPNSFVLLLSEWE